MDSSKEDAASASADPKPILSLTTTMSLNPSVLPLEWTKIQRKRPKLDGDEDTKNNESDPFCCDDATCSRRQPPGSFQGNGSNGGTAVPIKTGTVKTPATTTVSGKVVFCLPDTDPSWFQGYFFLNDRNSSSSKPWGLLAVQTDLDECLQCEDGGYRQVKLQVLTYSGHAATEQYSFDTVEWTGGDMMRLESETCRMIPSQFLADRAAVSHTEQFFGSLLRKLRMDSEVSDTASVLDLMPDVSVIVGSMELVVPVAAVHHLDVNNNDDGLFDE